ncbi:MAG: phosphoenolpyruvate carboxylase [Chloroflexi bacterium]|nr:MAG: phosphoenolpyruvate carboxylase [Chloroflexota bacterium]
MPPPDGGVPVPREDHLALLGHLEPAGDGARRLRQDRPVGRPAAPAQRPAPAVEQREPDPAPRRPGRQLRLGVEQRQRGEHGAALLGRVGVAEHHLDPAAALRQPLAHGGQVHDLVHDRGRPAQVVARLEEGHDVEDGRPAAGARGQLVHGRHVGRGPREADHVPPAGVHAVPALEVGHRPQRGQHLLRLRRPVSAGPDLGQRPLVDLPAVRERLAESGGRVEVMLGYSDSAKEGGPVFATLALFDAQAELTAWAARRRCGSPGDRCAIPVRRSDATAWAAASRRRTSALAGVVAASAVSARPTRRAAASRARSAWSPWTRIASAVTAAVTCGLPSRSPPTHVPKRVNAGASGGRIPASAGESAESRRR